MNKEDEMLVDNVVYEYKEDEEYKKNKNIIITFGGFYFQKIIIFLIFSLYSLFVG